MSKPKNLLVISMFSILFVALFYKQMMGLNLFLYNMILIALLHGVYKAFDFRNKTHVAVVAGALLTAVGVLWHASVLVIILNLLSLSLLFGVVNNARLTVPGNMVFSAVGQFFSGIFGICQADYFPSLNNRKVKKARKWIALSIIPILAVGFFFILYSASSSKFSAAFGFIETFIDNVFRFLSEYIDLPMFFVFCLGLIISSGYFVKIKAIGVFDEPATDVLTRTRRHGFSGAFNGLLTECRIAVIMFALLNALLAVFNVIDIWYVWIHFEWDGEILKEFVHQGTYILIFSLIVSVGLVLVAFRKNLNFFSGNKTVKMLANIWLAQNMVMAVSVLIRNFHYINYYNLAYLRIGVLLFIVIVFFGLITVMVKINSTKNMYYLLRVNMLFAYSALILFSLVDWDVVIVRFNFNRVDKALVHLDFMAGLSNKALPDLDKTEAEVKRIEQTDVYQSITWRDQFMTPDEYLARITERKQQFLTDYPRRSFLEWNLADYRAYQKLSK